METGTKIRELPVVTALESGLTHAKKERREGACLRAACLRALFRASPFGIPKLSDQRDSEMLVT